MDRKCYVGDGEHQAKEHVVQERMIGRGGHRRDEGRKKKRKKKQIVKQRNGRLKAVGRG